MGGYFLFFCSNNNFSIIRIQKKLKNSSISFLLVFASAITFQGGDILGLIPAAILSTFPNRNISE